MWNVERFSRSGAKRQLPIAVFNVKRGTAFLPWANRQLPIAVFNVLLVRQRISITGVRDGYPDFIGQRLLIAETF